MDERIRQMLLDQMRDGIRRKMGQMALGTREQQEAERSLAESESRFRFMAENLGGALYRLRYDGMHYDYMSPAIERLTGYTPDQINNVGFASLVRRVHHPGAEAADMEKLRAKRLAGETGEYQVDYLIMTREGHKRWLSDHSLPWLDQGGVLLGSVGILTDITRRKEAEMEREDLIIQLRQALDRVRRLSGLLSMCANCKSVHTDGGQWQKLEEFLHENSGADISHGLCPDCIRKLYPELNLEKK